MDSVVLLEAERGGGLLRADWRGVQVDRRAREGGVQVAAPMDGFGVWECWCPSSRWGQRREGTRSEGGASEFKLSEKTSHIQTQGCAVGIGAAWDPYSSQQFRRDWRLGRTRGAGQRHLP